MAQSCPEVEILYLGDNKSMSVGEKRNALLSIAKGDYVVYVDDDDIVSDNYVQKLLEAIEEGNDCITFGVMCSVNGGELKRVRYSIDYKKDFNTKTEYHRLPNHIMCVKRELVDWVRFGDKSYGEDVDYAKRLKKHLITETAIEDILYYYYFNIKTTETDPGR
jgi:glycosyltransferase involved in cell wall biosynthesis